MSELDVIQVFLQRSRTMFKNRNNTNIPIANEATNPFYRIIIDGTISDK